MFYHRELVILILALTLHAQVHTAEIYGGHEAAEHSRPYMVLLEMHMKNGGKKFCGGFLLSEDFVMTAAHCQAESYTVILGLHNFHDNKDVQRASVKESFPHKDYNATTLRNDIMLLKLSSKANFSKTVRPIPLPGQVHGSLPKSCSVSGWGRWERNSELMSPKLREVNVTLIDDENCAKENWFCSEGETGPAQGDSGGPLVCEDGKAYGVVSATFKPASGGPFLHRYIKTTDYRSWIISAMKTL